MPDSRSPAAIARASRLVFILFLMFPFFS